MRFCSLCGDYLKRTQINLNGIKIFTMLAPSAANFFAIASPIPLLAPLIKTVLPLKNLKIVGIKFVYGTFETHHS
jgi:hypothetical protein